MKNLAWCINIEIQMYKKVVLIVVTLFLSLTAYSQEEFVNKKALDDKISISIPKNFDLMSIEMLNAKYPIVEKRPSEVYTNSAGTINIALNLTQNQVAIDKLPELEKILQGQLSGTPNITFNFSEIKVINGQKFVILDFYSQATDTKIYNLMFVTSLNNRMLVGTFNCTEEYITNWKPYGQKILNSVKIL